MRVYPTRHFINLQGQLQIYNKRFCIFFLLPSQNRNNEPMFHWPRHGAIGSARRTFSFAHEKASAVSSDGPSGHVRRRNDVRDPCGPRGRNDSGGRH
jgi:hypothetical protein